MSGHVGEQAVGTTSADVRLAHVARFGAFVVLTCLAGVAGRSTFDADLGISLVWPLYGVGALWLASSTSRTRPLDVLGLAAASGAVILTTDGEWQRALFGSLAAVVAGGAWAITLRRAAPTVRVARSGRPMSGMRDLTGFGVACLVSAGLATVVRASGAGLLPPLGPADAFLTFFRNLSWLLAICGLGMLLLAHPDLGLRRWWATLERRGLRVVEALVVLSATALLTAVLFSPRSLPFAFPLVLGVVWAAFRLPTPVSVLLADLVGTYAVVATLAGRGPFTGQPPVAVQPYESATIAQALLITMVLPALAIAFGAQERRAAVDRALAAEREADSRAALFSAVIEHLAEGVSVITADDTYAVRNPAVHRMTGSGGFLRPDPDRPDQPVMVSDSGAPLAVPDMPHSRARNGESVVRETVRARFGTGEERTLEVTSIPVHGLGDDPRPVVVNTLRDVTRELEERDQLVSFAGVVAHDLKNPLTVVSGWTESLREELDAEAQPDLGVLLSMVARVQTASDQMHRFIDDLLAFTVARDRALHLVEVDLTAVAEEVAALRREGEARPRISVQPGMRVHADRALVRQLLDNLVGNSVKYVAAGVRPQIAVSAVERGAAEG